MRGILLSGAISAVVAFFATPALIRILARKGYGQIIRDDGPTTHQVKRGTPPANRSCPNNLCIVGIGFNSWIGFCWIYR